MRCDIRKGTHICIQCGKRNEALFQVFTRNVLCLQTCENCHQVVDKYVECDFVAVFIDILLLKISAYRHILFNSSKSQIYLPRLVALVLLSCSYVEWVYGKESPELGTKYMVDEDPLFFELEWGYYSIILRQSIEIAVFSAIFVLCAMFFLQCTSKNSSARYSVFYQLALEGIALSYCWSLVSIPSLVWNHYKMYKALSEFAFLISCTNIFYICFSHAVSAEPHYLLSIGTVSCSYALKCCAGKWLQTSFV